MKAATNWAAECAESIGIAAIYEIEDTEYLASVLSRLLPAFEYYLSGLSCGGACLEGIKY